MMAAAAAEGTDDRSGATYTAMATTTNSRFAAACGALSRYVKAAEIAPRSVDSLRPPPPVRLLLPLMPGTAADQDNDTAPPERQEEEHSQSQAGRAPAQLTIVYGGRVLVLDDVPADKAASLLRVAAAGATSAKPTPTDLPVARKASLQRFMERRVARVAARGGPYPRPGTRSSDRDVELTLAL